MRSRTRHGERKDNFSQDFNNERKGWNGLRAFKLMRYASRVPKYCGVD